MLATPKRGEGGPPATIQGVAAGTCHGEQAFASTENDLPADGADRMDLVEAF
jgi:hypothetical protein